MFTPLLRLLSIAALASLLVFGSAGLANAGGETAELDTAYLKWVRTELGTDSVANDWPEVHRKNLLVYPGEAIDHEEELASALSGSRILVVVLPQELQSRVYPRIFAASLLLREYQFDGVAILSGPEGGFASRFGWSECHDVLNTTGGPLIGKSTLDAVPGLKRCLAESEPEGWEATRKALIAQERNDSERANGVEIVKSPKRVAGKEEENRTRNTVAIAGAFAAGSLLLIAAVTGYREHRASRKNAKQSPHS